MCFLLKINCFKTLCPSSEAGGAVESAADTAEEGTSRKHDDGGASQRGNQQRVHRALLWDAERLHVRHFYLFALHVLECFSQIFRSYECVFVCVCVCVCFSQRLAREREILEERAERRLEIFKNLINKMATAGPSSDTQAMVTLFLRSQGKTGFVSLWLVRSYNYKVFMD